MGSYLKITLPLGFHQNRATGFPGPTRKARGLPP